MLEQQIEQDLKTALLGGDRTKTDTLRGLKSALLYAKVSAGKRDSGLSKEEELAVLTRESKKRQESADLYIKGNSEERAKAELSEKAIIDAYLPKQLSLEELQKVVDESIGELGVSDMSGMGRVISDVKTRTAGAAEGSLIAQIVKERLAK